VIPHGPFNLVRHESCDYGSSESFRFLFIGRIKPYKGVEDLLTAFASLPTASRVHLTIAGQCLDQTLLERLRDFSGHPKLSLFVGPERLADAEMSRILLAAHVVVLPFKAITTSGSAILAISHGKPVIIPQTAGMVNIPESAAIRYDGTVDGLVKALERVASMSALELGAMSEAASKHAHSVSWEEIAVRTMAEMTDILHSPRR
jgi:glycosyltransferase involved in cell wall biosynthesis